jgi:hypothetical protein
MIMERMVPVAAGDCRHFCRHSPRDLATFGALGALTKSARNARQ